MTLTPASGPRKPARRTVSATSAPAFTVGLAVFFLALALAVSPGCSRQESGNEQVDEARASYVEIRARVANLEQFFEQMEKVLWREQGDELVKAATGLVDEESRAYDAFLRSAEAAAAAYGDLESLGGKAAEYAGQLQALLDANKTEALLVKEAMVYVKEFVQPSLPSGTDEITAFTGLQNELSGRILESRETISRMETEAEEFYQANLAGE